MTIASIKDLKSLIIANIAALELDTYQENQEILGVISTCKKFVKWAGTGKALEVENGQDNPLHKIILYLLDKAYREDVSETLAEVCQSSFKGYTIEDIEGVRIVAKKLIEYIKAKEAKIVLEEGGPVLDNNILSRELINFDAYINSLKVYEENVELQDNISELDSLIFEGSSVKAVNKFRSIRPKSLMLDVAARFPYKISDKYFSLRAAMQESIDSGRKAAHKLHLAYAREISKGSDADKDKLNNLIDVASKEGWLNITDSDGMTMLMQAVAKSDYVTIEYLLSKGADPDVRDVQGRVALNVAISEDSREIAEALLRYRARIHIQDSKGETPSFLASSPLDYARWYLDLIRRYDRRYICVPEGDPYPLSNGYDLMNIIYKGTVDSFEKRLLFYKSLDSPRTLIEAINYSEIDDLNLLEKCVLERNIDIFEIILEYKEYLDFPERQLMKALNLAVNMISQVSSEASDFAAEMTKLLQQIGIGFDQDTLNQALIKSVESDELDLTAMYIKLGANVNYRDEDDETPLMCATRMSSEMIELLIANGADIEAKTEWGNTALSLAVYRNNLSALGALIKSKANASARNDTGDTPVTLALKLGRHNSVSKLVNEELDPHGYTPLMKNILSEDFEKVVIDKETIDAQTHGGFTALMMAAQKYCELVLEEDARANEILAIIFELLEQDADYSKSNKEGFSFLKIMAPIIIRESHSEVLMRIWKACGDGFVKQCIMHAPEIILILGGYCVDNEDQGKFALAINKLDDTGCSPLSYILFDTTRVSNVNERKNIAEAIWIMTKEFGAKYIRNGKETKSALHLKILARQGLPGTLTLDEDDIQFIDKVDELGRTPLHLACLQGRGGLALDLIALGANLGLQDSFGRTPVHYAAMSGALSVKKTDTSDEEGRILLVEDNNLLTIVDNWGVPAIIYLAQNAQSRSEMDDIIAKCRGLPHNEIVSEFLNNTVRKDTRVTDVKLNPVKNLALCSAIKHYYNLNLQQDMSDMMDEIAKTYIQDACLGNNDLFPPGFAMGFEFEVPEFPQCTYIPLSDILAWHRVTLVEDATVNPSILTSYLYNEEHFYEFVTHPVSTPKQYKEVLFFLNSLKGSGARANHSAGLHIHFNCRGSATQGIPRFVPEDKEFAYIKYLALNYISVEQLLRGSIRDGDIYDAFGGSYVETLGMHREEIMQCSTIEELQRICAHKTTLDLTALDRHGTVEFRLHDAVVDPVLLHAWADSMSRLVNISREQAMQHEIGDEFAPKENIEELVYILIAMRMYPDTWSEELGSVATADMRVAGSYSKTDSRPAQVIIQRSPVYNLFVLLLEVKKVDNLDEALRGYSLSLTEADITRLLEMINYAYDNPGIQVLPDRSEVFNKMINLPVMGDGKELKLEDLVQQPDRQVQVSLPNKPFKNP